MAFRKGTVTRVSESFGEKATVEDVPALTLLCHPDIRRVGERVTLPRLAKGSPVELSRVEPLFAAPGDGRRRSLDVSYISRKPLRLSPTLEGVLLERCGASTPVEVDGEPLDDQCVLSNVAMDEGVVLELGRRVVLLLHRLPVISEEVAAFSLVGESHAVQRLRSDIALAAGDEASVLLRGPSGSGKELVARAVHEASGRHEGPWITVNMAAVPPSLAAAELFGSQKGAFTGADRPRKGYFGAADGGTLFLDEIGDTPPEVQPLLLRALENGEIQPVGGAQSQRVDVRVIAATDADLEAQVADGRFRTPLLHRLAALHIRLPSLAERRDDIGRLLVHFLVRELGGLERLQEAAGTPMERPWPPAPLVARLAAYEWPGNVRQLANVARRLAIALRAGREVDVGIVDSLIHGGSLEGSVATEVTSTRPSGSDAAFAETSSPTGRWRPVLRKAEDVSEDELLEALRASHFRLAPTAEALGISRTVLYKLVDDCPRVRKAADLDRDEIEQALAESVEEEAVAQSLEVSLHGLRLRMKALGLR